MDAFASVIRTPDIIMRALTVISIAFMFPHSLSATMDELDLPFQENPFTMFYVIGVSLLACSSASIS